ncbi:MAG: hypothetical protein Fur0044_02200 [Anaerolineae bacterium]|nr:hypothetical protein [Anaerolineales bacterium]MCQ3974647.1 hypothetical protein [Anaerolineae bacterium]
MSTPVEVKNGYEEQAVKVASKVKTTAVAQIARAANTAAVLYTSDEVQQQAQAIITAWEAKLQEQSKQYVQRLMAASQGEQLEAAGPITFHPAPYQWWNLLLAGPFQPVAPLGPFLPSKIIRAGEPAFMIATLWRNPAPLPGGPNPSAAQIMAPFNFSIWLETINLTHVVNGPDFPAGGLAGVFGPGNINSFFIPISFPAPVDGRPTLYEMNMVVDILGPGVGLPPFAGYSTWVFDPDFEPPFLGLPGVGPQFQHDIPARFAVYV